MSAPDRLAQLLAATPAHLVKSETCLAQVQHPRDRTQGGAETLVRPHSRRDVVVAVNGIHGVRRGQQVAQARERELGIRAQGQALRARLLEQRRQQRRQFGHVGVAPHAAHPAVDVE